MSDLPLEKPTRVLPITREQIAHPTRWECTGKSPSNTPQAQIQMAQMFLQMLANPSIAQYINVKGLLNVLIKAGSLQNASDIIQDPPPPPQQPMPPQPNAQTPTPPEAGQQPPNVVSPPTGGNPLAGLPPELVGEMQGGMPQTGPIQPHSTYFSSPSQVPAPQ